MLLHHNQFICSYQGFRAFTTARDGSKCLAMEYGGEQSLNDLIEKRREDGLKAFPAANIEKVALHVARGLQVNHGLNVSHLDQIQLQLDSLHTCVPVYS